MFAGFPLWLCKSTAFCHFSPHRHVTLVLLFVFMCITKVTIIIHYAGIYDFSRAAAGTSRGVVVVVQPSLLLQYCVMSQSYEIPAGESGSSSNDHSSLLAGLLCLHPLIPPETNQEYSAGSPSSRSLYSDPRKS